MPDWAALDKLAKGRALAVKRAPYFSSAIYGMVPVEAPGCGTLFVTPGMVMGYDPEFVKKQEDEVMASGIVHEVNHILRDTSGRGKGLNGSVFNIASDAIINEDLKKAGFPLGSGWIELSTYGLPDGKTTEELYEILSRMDLPQGGGGGLGAGGCGGIAGNPIDRELEEELDKQHGQSPIKKKTVQKQVAESYKKAMAGRGHVFGDLMEEILAADGPAKVPWSQVLGHSIKKCMTHLAMGATDYSMSRLSTRTFARDDGILRPGLVAYEPSILLCLDTSGSMGQEQLASAFREMIGVFKTLPSTSHVWYMEADADVACQPRMVRVRDLSRVEIHGRGGTDFRPAVAYAEKMKPRPDLLIYLTDGDGFAPTEPPRGIEVIWCVVPSYWRKKPAPWGKTIFVDSDGAKEEEAEETDDDV
jgi:predicted metal-dependent peptidase